MKETKQKAVGERSEEEAGRQLSLKREAATRPPGPTKAPNLLLLLQLAVFDWICQCNSCKLWNEITSSA